MKKIFMYITLLMIMVSSCHEKSAPNPWNTPADTVSMDDILAGGELILATMSGPDTYYEYRGQGMGLQYLLCQELSRHLGVSLRVEVCRDSLEMIAKVDAGEADVASTWYVAKGNEDLAASIKEIITDSLVQTVKADEAAMLAAPAVTRRVYSPVINRSKGVISSYDHLFRRHAATAGVDWHLLAAQCYQESCFDAAAHSWAGACGLMQIMPSTADELGLDRGDIYDPEKNVAAAAKYMSWLMREFRDVASSTDRVKFVLASYNGGRHHVRDAMALVRKYGGNAHRWEDVKVQILNLATAKYYRDEVVNYGYMRGSETADYVDKIWDRWLYYRGVKSSPVSGGSSSGGSPSPVNVMKGSGVKPPHPSARTKEKYNI